MGEGAGEALATVNMVDPDGRKLRITGEQQDATLKFLSKLFGSELHLKDNHVTITNEPKQYNTNSKLISEIINNENIIVELWTIKGNKIEDEYGVHDFCGGAFLGSETKDSKVYTKQAINLDILCKIDNFGGDMGDSFMHELSESYHGGVYAYNYGIAKIKPAYTNEINEVYKYAHEEAFPTKRVRTKFVNYKGQEVFGEELFYKRYWIIKYNSREYKIDSVYNTPKLIKKKR